jgi:hypothetical protein
MKRATTPDASARELAFRIALRFRDHVPSAREVMAAFPELTRASAYRYARDFHRACRRAA